MKTINTPLLAVVLSFSLIWALSVNADETGSSVLEKQSSAKEEAEWQSRWYGGMGIGISNLEPDSDGTPYSIDDKRGKGGRIYIGYDLFKRLSLEGYYSDLGESKLAPTGTIEYQDIGLSALYYLYKQGINHEGLGLFAKAGAGRMRNQADVPYTRLNDYHLLWGGGIEYAFENGFALRGDFDFYDKDSQFVTLSLMKRFGDIKPPPEPEPEPAPVVPVVVKEIDSDGDGVVDGKDKCPDTFRGAAVDADGCELDSDNDGVVDRLDRCPDTVAGAKVDEYGCEIKEIVVLKGVYFDTDESVLTTKAQYTLQGVAEILHKNSEIIVDVVGHTDNRGTYDYNQQLSKLRAEAVRDYLIDLGISAERLKIKGFGYDRPASDNSTPEGRAINRRVELHVIGSMIR